MWVCAYCETENSNNSAVCACCGQARIKNSSKPPQKPLRKWLICLAGFLLIAFLAAALIIGGTKGETKKSDQQSTVPASNGVEELKTADQKTVVYNNSENPIIALAAGSKHIVALLEDGTVLATGDNEYGQCDVSDWKDVVAISAWNYKTIGLKADGTVLTTAPNKEPETWTDIVAISQGDIHTAGLKADGTVVFSPTDYGTFSVSAWKNIAAVSVGVDHMVGLRADGTVVATGSNDLGACEVSDWRDIIAVSAGSFVTAGLKSDGTVVTTSKWMDVSGWTDVKSISCSHFEDLLLGVRSDGTVLTSNKYGWTNELSGLTDVAEIAQGSFFAQVQKADGTMETRQCTFAVVRQNDGRITLWSNDDSLLDGVFDVSGWKGISQQSDNNSNAVTVGADTKKTTENGKSSNPIVAIAAGNEHIVALREDGTVSATGDNEHGQCNVSDWKDVIAISARDYETVGLKADGTVLTTNSTNYMEKWTDIIAIDRGGVHIVGLKADGTVVADHGNNSNEFGECSVSDWKKITAISAGGNHTVGLKADGTVVAAGENACGECEVSDWRNIVAVSAGWFYTVGLKSDGTVVTTNKDIDVSGWRNIKKIYSSPTEEYVVAIRSDGTVLTSEKTVHVEGLLGLTDVAEIAQGGFYAEVGKEGGKKENRWCDFAVVLRNDGQVTLWSNDDSLLDGVFNLRELEPENQNEPGSTETIDSHLSIKPARTVIAAGNEFTLALRKDGTALATGYNEDGRCDVSSWRNLISVAAGSSHAVGLRSDGTVVATGINRDGACEVSGWRDIVCIAAGAGFTVGLKADGTVACTDNKELQSELATWRNIASISAGDYMVAGLKADGTVVTAGWKCWDEELQKDVTPDLSGWRDIISISTDGICVLGLKADGTVVSSKGNQWAGEKNITAVYACRLWQVGVRADGSSVTYGEKYEAKNGWTNLVGADASEYHFVAARADGTVLVTGQTGWGEGNVSDWRDVGLAE